MEIIPRFNLKILRWFMFKKDCELPWVTRIGRWAILVFGIGWIAHCFMNWFGG